MRRNLSSFAAAAVLLAPLGSQTTWVQQPGGIPRMLHIDSPAACRSAHNRVYREFVNPLRPQRGEGDL